MNYTQRPPSESGRPRAHLRATAVAGVVVIGLLGIGIGAAWPDGANDESTTSLNTSTADASLAADVRSTDGTRDSDDAAGIDEAAQEPVAIELDEATHADDANQTPATDAAIAVAPPTTSYYSLDGSGNHVDVPAQGSVDTAYLRIAEAAYDDGISAPVVGPDARYVSNRVFNDLAQNIFSENDVSQWAPNWGQFIDHTIGLRAESLDPLEMPFDASDPLEDFGHDGDTMITTRSAAQPGTGETTPREQVNTVSSYLDAWAVYGGTDERLEWLREGPVDSDLSNNSAKLLLTSDGHLPTAVERGDAEASPAMEPVGRLRMPGTEVERVVAGDMRANENISLTMVHTLFAREHNRIVDQLPAEWSEQQKFDVARQLVIGTQQYITYEEFLPAIGVDMADYTGYQPGVDASVSNEFATVGYRAHSMIHGEVEVLADADRYTEAELDAFRAQGIEVHVEGDEVELAVPLNVAFANPQLVPAVGVGDIARGIGLERQYRNDEQIDNQLRSVLFQLPGPDVENPDTCLDGIELPECFALVNDLGVLDVVRGREHGIPLYNDLREAYGLARITSFAELTGESSEDFGDGIDPAVAIDDPSTLEFVELRHADGTILELGSDEADAETVEAIRGSTLAARLKAIYGDVDQVDAFVGMVSEPHLSGSELGELQHAMWKRQFEALRDGDRLFHENNELLAWVEAELGLTHRRTLAQIIADNSDVDAADLQDNMFVAP